MRYYVIINGVNSLSIKGLAIKTLPSIIKPMMRTLREEIDGRNGDVITNLGYSAYDKQLEIGLYGEYDIDSIMAYFNQKGTIIFSDEADKIYNFKILDQIDYAKLLKFKTAVVNLHIQPFKYPLSETPIELIDSYVEGEGESLTLNETESAPLEIDLKGNTSQVVIPGEEGLEEIDTSMTLTDVIPTKEDYITLKGNTSQVQYSGKNLLPNSATSTTTNNLTITVNEDKSIKINGTANADTSITIVGAYSAKHLDLTAGTYKILGSIGGSATTYRIMLYDSNWGYIAQSQNGSSSFTLSEDKLTLLCIINVTNGTQMNNVMFYPMIMKSTETSETYEPYVGSTSTNITPSPNPDYPQDIHSVSGDNEIEVCGENLFDKNSPYLVNGYLNANGNITTNASYRVSNYMYIGNFSKITIAGNTENGLVYCFYDENKTLLGANSISGSTKTITPPTNTKYIRTTISASGLDSYMVVEGETAPSEYIPYTGNTYHITLPNGIELNKIGNYQDKIVKTDKWYWYREIGEVVFNGTEGWAKGSASTTDYSVFQRSTTIDNNTDTDELYSNNFTNIGLSSVLTSYDYENIGLNNGSKHLIRIWVKVSRLATNDTTGFKAWLSTHNTKVNYILENPTYTEITDTTLLSQLDDLYNATIYETTNISSIPNDLEPFIDIKYNVVTPSPSPQRPSAINVVSGTNTITIANQDSSETQTLQIRLGSIKLRYVDEAQDYIYKSGDKWYTHALTGEKTFVGNSAEGWAMTSTPRGLKEFTAQISDMKKNSSIYCDNFTQVPETTQMAYETYTPSIATTNSKSVFIMLGDGSISAGSDFRTWLSTHNTTVVYPLNTAVDTEITDTDLLEDLEALLEAVSYANQTNISQTNNDKPFILYAKALKQGSGESIVENTGNIYAKPTFEIEGTGLVQVLIDNNQVLEVDTTNDTIVIDTENMEAINKTDGTLANRQVVGDYSKIKLNVGNNDVKLTGNYTKGTITKYTRYL